MRDLETPIRKGKQLRTLGFDDSPFDRDSAISVDLAGVVCSGTRFEGMLWGSIEHDGFDAADVILEMVSKSKFRDQVNLILTDGVTVGGFNVVDLHRIATSLEIPCIAVMRRLPDLDAFYAAMEFVGQV